MITDSLLKKPEFISALRNAAFGQAEHTQKYPSAVTPEFIVRSYNPNDKDASRSWYIQDAIITEDISNMYIAGAIYEKGKSTGFYVVFSKKIDENFSDDLRILTGVIRYKELTCIGVSTLPDICSFLSGKTDDIAFNKAAELPQFFGPGFQTYGSFAKEKEVNKSEIKETFVISTTPTPVYFISTCYIGNENYRIESLTKSVEEVTKTRFLPSVEPDPDSVREQVRQANG